MSKKRKKKYPIPNAKNRLQSLSLTSKYKIGATGRSFYDIKKQKPVFAFDYLSLNKTELCFNEKIKKRDDLLGFLEGLKKISSVTYEKMKKEKPLRFHEIKFDDKSVNIKPKDFIKVLAPSNRGLEEKELPTLYQFDIQYKIEARVVGFLFNGVFYIVWYDRWHTIYKKK